MSSKTVIILSFGFLALQSNAALAKITVSGEGDKLIIVYESDLMPDGKPFDYFPAIEKTVKELVEKVSGKPYLPSFDEDPDVSQTWSDRQDAPKYYQRRLEYDGFFTNENTQVRTPEEWITLIREALTTQPVGRPAQDLDFSSRTYLAHVAAPLIAGWFARLSAWLGAATKRR